MLTRSQTMQLTIFSCVPADELVGRPKPPLQMLVSTTGTLKDLADVAKDKYAQDYGERPVQVCFRGVNGVLNTGEQLGDLFVHSPTPLVVVCPTPLEHH